MREISVIWIAQDYAAIHKISDEEMMRTALRKTGQTSDYFEVIYQNIKLTPMILILGPDHFKFDLKLYLLKKDLKMSKKIVGCEAVDSLSDQQTAALAMKYIRKEI